MRLKLKAILLSLLAASSIQAAEHVYDLLVYGGNSAGVMAAVQARRMGMDVLLVEPGKHVGGLTAGGLGATDIGREDAIGGLAREFYHFIYRYYLEDSGAWKNEDRVSFAKRHVDGIHEHYKMHFFFEPHVAERTFHSFLSQHNVPVIFEERLDRSSPQAGVILEGKRIKAIRTESGKTYHARIFMDCTYEGDLMAAAGVSHIIGRESIAKYDESYAGIRYVVSKNVPNALSPYIVDGDSSSGLLPNITDGPVGPEGEGDHRIQAYNFRLCLTDDPENQVAIAQPASYNPLNYELALRWLKVKPDLFPGKSFIKLTPMPNRKTDSNNQGAISTDYVGHSYEWTEASYERRREIWQEHKDYIQGFLWFLTNEPRVPAKIRTEMSRWGLARDEFKDSDNWPHQLYVRQARRMISDYVVTQHDCQASIPAAEDVVALGSYAMDSHQVSRFVDKETHLLRFEGGFYKSISPYPISYRAIVPKKGECPNLIVPVCLSSSHVAYGSIRMEPVFMILGQSGALAASIAVKNNLDVQDVPYTKLRPLLDETQQILWAPKQRPPRPKR